MNRSGELAEIFRQSWPGLRILQLAGGRHGLETTDEPSARLVYDFTGGRLGFRLTGVRHSREDLVRALGCKPSETRVLDATAGLGRDTLILAARGYRVVACERHPLLFALLSEAFTEIRASPEPSFLKVLLENVELRHQEAAAVLENPAEPFAMAIFDPMFPERKKRARVRQELQVLQVLLGEDADADAASTLERLRAGVREKVVVKRPLHAPPLAGEPPHHCLKGRTVRFDVYSAL